MKPLKYEAPTPQPASAALVALYWLCYIGAVLAALLALGFALLSLTGFGWIEERQPPPMWCRLVSASPFLLYAVLAVLPFHWTVRGVSYWFRLLVLVLPAVWICARMGLEVVRGHPPHPIAAVASGGMLALSLMPACALTLCRHLNRRDRSPLDERCAVYFHSRS